MWYLFIVLKIRLDRILVVVLIDFLKFGIWLNNVKLNNGEEKLFSDGD